MSSVKAQLADSLRTSKEYRHSFVEEKIRTGLAAQVKAIREHIEGGMTQPQFANKIGKAQSWVARLENPNAKPPTLSTLLEVARALDVDLVVRFAPFSELVDWLTGAPHVLPGLSEESLAVPDFEHDIGLAQEAEVSVGLTDILHAFEKSFPATQQAEEDIRPDLTKKVGAASTTKGSDSRKYLLNQGAPTLQGQAAA